MDFLNKTRNMSSGLFLTIYLAVPFIYRLLLGLQGFDMHDEGWCLVGYQQLFEHPTSAEYQFLYYNGLLVGALWNALFAKFGILGFRVFAVICNTIISYMVYKLLYKHINRWHIMIGMLILLACSNRTMIFHHNLLTSLICCLSVYFIFKSLTTSCYWKMIVAGILIGINVFTRIPNLSMLSLSLVLIPFYIHTKDLKRTLRMLLYAAIGFIIGLFIEFLIMITINHWDIFVNNLSSGFSAASSADSTHSISHLIYTYFWNYSFVFFQIILLASGPILSIVTLHFINNKKISTAICIVIGTAICFLTIYFSNGIFTIYAFCYLSVILYTLYEYKNKRIDYEMLLLVSLAIIVLFFLPFGSDGGISNMGGSCIFFAVPLCISLLVKTIKTINCKQKTKHIITNVIVSFTIVFCCKSLYYTTQINSSDRDSRFKETEQINHQLANTFTTTKKCAITNELIQTLNHYVQAGDYLLCWQSLPMVHYLTHTYPYLNNSWPWTYDSSNLERHFMKAEQEIHELPVVLCNKSNIGRWDTLDPDWDNENATDQGNFNTRKIKAFHYFIEKNQYITVWEDSLFRIMLPPDRINKETH